MAEGARLESVCAGNGTVGSNPTLSALQLIEIDSINNKGSRSLTIWTCEPCQDRKVAAISSVSYVFGISWAF